MTNYDVPVLVNGKLPLSVIPDGIPTGTGGTGAPGTGFTPRGAWTISTTYAVNDIVTANGSTFRVKTPHTSTGTAPTATTPGSNYEVWAAAGTAGAQGTQGLQGAIGPQGPAGTDAKVGMQYRIYDSLNNVWPAANRNPGAIIYWDCYPLTVGVGAVMPPEIANGDYVVDKVS